MRGRRAERPTPPHLRPRRGGARRERQPRARASGRDGARRDDPARPARGARGRGTGDRLRPGLPTDLPRVIDLGGADVRLGRRDCVRDDAYLARVLAGLDWAAGTRMVDGQGGELDGAGLVFNRATLLGAVTSIEATAAEDRPQLVDDLTRWGLGLSRAAGAVAAQV